MLPSWIRSRKDMPRPMYFFPSETSTPMSRNTLKIRKSWSGSSSTSGKPARMSSGLRNPCSLPLTIRASAASTIGSSERLSFPPPGAAAFLGVGASLRLALAMSHFQPSRPSSGEIQNRVHFLDADRRQDPFPGVVIAGLDRPGHRLRLLGRWRPSDPHHPQDLWLLERGGDLPVRDLDPHVP